MIPRDHMQRYKFVPIIRILAACYLMILPRDLTYQQHNTKRYQTNKTRAYDNVFSFSPVLSNHNSVAEFFIEVPFTMAGSNLLQIRHVVTQFLDSLNLLV